ncbi:MAG: ExeA family protein [Desulfobacterales bacterium]
MYESFYGFREKPFQISPDPSFLYLSPNHNHALQYLEYGIERNIGIILLSGEVGSGKTTLIQYLRQQLGRHLEIAVITNTNLSANDLISYVLIELNIQPDANSKALNINLFKAYLKSLDAEGRRLVLIIDEAQNLPREALEEIRMLSNFQADDGLPLQIFLIGQPELRTILKSPGMHQLRQRIAVNYHLNGLNREETQKYIEYRQQKAGRATNLFTNAAVDRIYQTTSGIPRSINILCDSSLLFGFAEEVDTIDDGVINSVMNELNLQSFVQKSGHDDPDSGEGSSGPKRPHTTEVPAKSPKEIKPENTLKKGMVVLKRQLDKMDVKFDLLRDEVLKKVNGSMMAERKRYEDLLVAHAKMQAELERIKAALENARAKDGTAKRAFDGNDAEGGGKPGSDRKVYQLEK